MFYQLDSTFSYVHAKFQGPESQFGDTAKIKLSQKVLFAIFGTLEAGRKKTARRILNLMVSTPTKSGSDYNISKFQDNRRTRNTRKAISILDFDRYIQLADLPQWSISIIMAFRASELAETP